MIVSLADASHVGDVVEMLEATRLRYQEYQPVFWRKAPDSAKSTREFLLTTVDETATLFLIAADKSELVDRLSAIFSQKSLWGRSFMSKRVLGSLCGVESATTAQTAP